MRFNILLASIAMAMVSTACKGTPSDAEVQQPAVLMTWGDLVSRDLPQPSSTHVYGNDASQVADLWLPDGPGPHPAVLMVHGGCWQKAVADRTLMNYAAEDLRKRGMAVWNIEYRGVDEQGGGYPGTYLDVSLAAETLRVKGPELGLDVDRIVAVGHSAGGHLAAWLATQENLPSESLVNTGNSLSLAAVVISGGLVDLEASAPVTLDSCLTGIIDDLTGLPDESRQNVFSDTSPSELLPVDSIFISVNGDSDGIAPSILGRGLTDKVQAAGGAAHFVEVPETGHVELVTPGTEAFNVQADLLLLHLGQ